MNRLKISLRWTLMIMLGLTVAMTSLTQPAQADDAEDLRERMKERYATLLRLMNQQKIGETHEGYVEVVKARYRSEKLSEDDDAKTIGEIVDEENADRLLLYREAAREHNITVAQAGKINAKRKFKKADPDHYLLLPGGRWVLKKDLDKDD